MRHLDGAATIRAMKVVLLERKKGVFFVLFFVFYLRWLSERHLKQRGLGYEKTFGWHERSLVQLWGSFRAEWGTAYQVTWRVVSLWWASIWKGAGLPVVIRVVLPLLLISCVTGTLWNGRGQRLGLVELPCKNSVILQKGHRSHENAMLP